MRFVDDTDTIREEFVEFVTVDRITGEALAAKLNPFTVKFLQHWSYFYIYIFYISHELLTNVLSNHIHPSSL